MPVYNKRLRRRCDNSAMMLDILFSLPPAMKLGQGNVFTGVCDSVNRGVLSQHVLQVVSQHALQQVSSGCYPSMHCRWYPSMPCSRGVFLQGGSPGGFSGGVDFCYGLLLWSSDMAVWFGGLLIWSSGGGATTPEGHHRGGAWWRPPQMATAAGSTHPTGMHSCWKQWSHLKMGCNPILEWLHWEQNH